MGNDMTTEKQTNNGRAWLMLMLASAFEIGYALSVASSKAFTVLDWSLAAGVFFLLTLYTLSVALRTIDVGIGYAVWAGIGSVGAAALGSVMLHQPLTLAQAFWLAVIIAGVVWLKLADSARLATLAQGAASGARQ
jgi:quaternary ammonium compound-resistance protein SugE